MISEEIFITEFLKKIKDCFPSQLYPYLIPIKSISGDSVGYLRPIVKVDSLDPLMVALLAQWRKENQHWFPSAFRVTLEGTKRWMDEQLYQKTDRILFFVLNNQQKMVGHVGLYRFNYQNNFCELDNIIRGNINLSPGIMTMACQELVEWCFQQLKLKKIYLRVFSDNEKAINLYKRLGFLEIQRVPLCKVSEEENVFWKEVYQTPYLEIRRYFVTMSYENAKKDYHCNTML